MSRLYFSDLSLSIFRKNLKKDNDILVAKVFGLN